MLGAIRYIKFVRVGKYLKNLLRSLKNNSVTLKIGFYTDSGNETIDVGNIKSFANFEKISNLLLAVTTQTYNEDSIRIRGAVM